MNRSINLYGIYIKQNIREDFKFLKELGQCQQGIIFLAKNRITQELRVVKAIAKESNEKYLELLNNEISIQYQINHSSILKLYDVYESNSTLYLVLEYIFKNFVTQFYQRYCEGGNLLELIQSYKYLPEDMACIIMKQIFYAVAYCHSQNICHRNLKLENFLFKFKNDITSIKLVDFTLSKKFTQNEIMTEVIGTPFYLAPEIINCQYGYEVDNWALGVILYIMLCGCPPFSGNSTQNILLAINDGKFYFTDQQFTNCSKKVKSLITQLLKREPQKRCNAQQAYLHQ